MQRTRAHDSIFHYDGKSLHAAFTEPEVFNLAGGRALDVRSDWGRLELEDPAFVQVVKASQTRRIRALGEHVEASSSSSGLLSNSRHQQL
jgi:hypothetical protein